MTDETDDDADDGTDDIEALEIEQLQANVELKRANVRLTDLMADRIECQISTGYESTNEINSRIAELRDVESQVLDLVRAKLEAASARIEPQTLATLDVQSPSHVVLAAAIVSAAALIIAGHSNAGLCFLAVGPAFALLPHVTRHFPDLLKDSSSRG